MWFVSLTVRQFFYWGGGGLIYEYPLCFYAFNSMTKRFIFVCFYSKKKKRRNFLTERRQSLCNISTLFMMVIAWRRRSTDLNEHSWRSDEKRTDPDKNGYKLRMFHRAKWSGLQRIQNRNESVDEKREINDMIMLPIQNLELKKKRWKNFVLSICFDDLWNNKNKTNAKNSPCSFCKE